MKKYLLSACAIVLAIAFTAFTSPRFATVTYGYVGSTFTMGDAATPLDVDANWDSSDPTCSTVGGSQNKLCKAIATYATTVPTEAQIRSAVKTKYIANSNTFSDLESFQVTLNSETVTIVIDLKEF